MNQSVESTTALGSAGTITSGHHPVIKKITKCINHSSGSLSLTIEKWKFLVTFSQYVGHSKTNCSNSWIQSMEHNTNKTDKTTHSVQLRNVSGAGISLSASHRPHFCYYIQERKRYIGSIHQILHVEKVV